MRNEILLGAHMSIAGGLENTIYNGKKLGCKTIQIFTKNNNQWRSKPLLENEIEKFEQIAEIIEKTEKNHRLCVCIDTCHIFSAGYDIRNEKSYNKTMCEFERIIGLNKLKIIHMNDSKRELGSRIDRHQHIGKGFIGLKTFELIMNDEKLNKIPKIIETPKGKSFRDDIINLNLLRSLLK